MLCITLCSTWNSNMLLSKGVVNALHFKVDIQRQSAGSKLIPLGNEARLLQAPPESRKYIKPWNWLEMENRLKYPPLQNLHFLQAPYILTISGGADYFSPGCKAEHVCALCRPPPLPLNCNSVSWGCHLGWIFHEGGCLCFSKLSGECNCLKTRELVSVHFTLSNSSYVAENVWKCHAHLYFSFFFYQKEGKVR